MAAVNAWKVLGVAGLLGVSATGAAVVRAERRRRAVTPEEVRARLHARHAGLPPEQSRAPAAPASAGAPVRAAAGRTGRWRRLLRRR